VAIKTKGFGDSNVGRVRKSNQDSGYTGYNLFFVADGMGGHAGGDIASALATQQIAQLDANYTDENEASKALLNAMWTGNAMLTETVAKHSELAGMGTTVSAVLFTGSKAVIAHIGDSRVYLVRGGSVKQITKDHTFVQRLVDTGRITPEEALVHPRRSVLMRVLGDVEEFPEIDTQTIEVRAGDRFMLCSDGLCGVVPEEISDGILLSTADPDEAVSLLVGEALEFGAPDNVTVVVVDVTSASASAKATAVPKFHGSAANEVVIEERKGMSNIIRLLNPRVLVDLFGNGTDDETAVPESAEYLDKIMAQTRTRIRNRWIRQLATVVLLAGIAFLALVGAYKFTQTRFYVGSYLGHVAIYRGINEAMGPFKFSHVYKTTDLTFSELSSFQRDIVRATISAENLADANRIVEAIRSAVPSE